MIRRNSISNLERLEKDGIELDFGPFRDLIRDPDQDERCSNHPSGENEDMREYAEETPTTLKEAGFDLISACTEEDCDPTLASTEEEDFNPTPILERSWK